MVKAVLTLSLLVILAACQSTEPAKSKCFTRGRISCNFTPLENLVGHYEIDKNADNKNATP